MLTSTRIALCTLLSGAVLVSAGCSEETPELVEPATTMDRSETAPALSDAPLPERPSAASLEENVDEDRNMASEPAQGAQEPMTSESRPTTAVGSDSAELNPDNAQSNDETSSNEPRRVDATTGVDKAR